MLFFNYLLADALNPIIHFSHLSFLYRKKQAYINYKPAMY